MSRRPSFADQVARAKSMSIGGQLTPEDRTGLLRRGLSMGLSTDDAALLLEEVPPRHPATSIGE